MNSAFVLRNFCCDLGVNRLDCFNRCQFNRNVGQVSSDVLCWCFPAMSSSFTHIAGGWSHQRTAIDGAKSGPHAELLYHRYMITGSTKLVVYWKSWIRLWKGSWHSGRIGRKKRSVHKKKKEAAAFAKESGDLKPTLLPSAKRSQH